MGPVPLHTDHCLILALTLGQALLPKPFPHEERDAQGRNHEPSATAQGDGRARIQAQVLAPGLLANHPGLRGEQAAWWWLNTSLWSCTTGFNHDFH